MSDEGTPKSLRAALNGPNKVQWSKALWREFDRAIEREMDGPAGRASLDPSLSRLAGQAPNCGNDGSSKHGLNWLLPLTDWRLESV